MLLKNKYGLGNDEALTTQLLNIKYRPKILGWLIAAFFPAVFVALAWSQSGNTRIASWGIFVFLVAQFGFRFFKEQSIIGNLAGAVGTVVAGNRKPLEAGHVNSLRYRFTAVDGKAYPGRTGWSGRDLLDPGYPLPILYHRNDPSNNLAYFDFKFYAFNLEEHSWQD